MGVSQRAIETVGCVAEIASSDDPAIHRIQAVVSSLSLVMPHVAAHVAAVENGQAVTVYADGYPKNVLDRFTSTGWMSEALETLACGGTGGLNVLRQQDLPEAKNVTVNEYLRPAGFGEGITQLLLDRRGHMKGVLNLSCIDPGDATEEARDVVAQIDGALSNLIQEAKQTSGPEWIYLLHADGRVSNRCGSTAVGQFDAAPSVSIVEMELRRLGRVQPSLSGIALGGDGVTSHEIQVAPLSSFGGIPAQAVIVIRPARTTPLSPREVEVLKLIAAGMSNIEISHELAIAKRTVSSHVEHILLRLGVKSRTAAAVFACRNGLL